MAEPRKTLGVLLFPQFELLDVFGPLEMLGYVPDLDTTLLARVARRHARTHSPLRLHLCGDEVTFLGITQRQRASSYCWHVTIANFSER